LASGFYRKVESNRRFAVEEVQEVYAFGFAVNFLFLRYPLEILYNVIDEDTVQVFHAMKCRSALIPLLK
jgi:hypothetical protein